MQGREARCLGVFGAITLRTERRAISKTGGFERLDGKSDHLRNFRRIARRDLARTNRIHNVRHNVGCIARAIDWPQEGPRASDNRLITITLSLV